MNCPNDIATILLRIISASLLRIRQYGREGLAEDCEVEADHVHNLPALLLDFTPELLGFYWNIERVAFLEATKEKSLGELKEEWQRLHFLMKKHGILENFES